MTAAAAQALGDNLLEYEDHVSSIFELRTYLNGLDHVRGDVVELDHFFRSSTKLEVLELRIHPGGVGDPSWIEFTFADREEHPQ